MALLLLLLLSCYYTHALGRENKHYKACHVSKNNTYIKIAPSSLYFKKGHAIQHSCLKKIQQDIFMMPL